MRAKLPRKTLYNRSPRDTVSVQLLGGFNSCSNEMTLFNCSGVLKIL